MEILTAKTVLYNNLPIFNSFEKQFGDRLISLFPILKKISIKTFSMQQYKSAQENYIIQIKYPEKQPLSCFIYNNTGAIEDTICGIVINDDLINSLKISEHEIYAGIAHEIGHILYFFAENKDVNKEEFFADSVACKLNLKNEMCQLIEKVLMTNIYPQSTNNQLRIRQLFLQS